MVGTRSVPIYLVVTAAFFALAISFLATALLVRTRARRRRELKAREELNPEQREWLERF